MATLVETRVQSFSRLERMKPSSILFGVKGIDQSFGRRSRHSVERITNGIISVLSVTRLIIE